MAAGIPDAVVRLIAEHIDSIEAMEVVLLLKRHRDRDWSAAEVAGELARQPDSVSNCLDRLSRRRLLTMETASERRYRYGPASTELSCAVEGLESAYSARKVRVVALILARPSESVRSFADAFRLRRED